MLKKTITFKNFNDEEVSEDHFFHLSKAELVELEMGTKGGLSEWLQKIIDAEDGKAIITEFKKIVLGAYGEKSADGKRFVKTQELRDEFESSEAYSTLFMELVTDAGAAAEFVNGIVPKGLEQDIAKITQLRSVPEQSENQQEKSEDQQLAMEEPTIVTRAAITEMSQEELQALGAQLASGKAVLANEGNQ